ncbi:MAG: hypothetical protein CFH07_01695, partial [Alphaproteobacteria bacterium MarineAlpha3_Bin6]
ESELAFPVRDPMGDSMQHVIINVNNDALNN